MDDLIFEPQAKLLWHGDKVKKWLETGRINPILVEIAPTGYCNASCPWCFFKEKQDKERISTPVLLRAIDDLVKLGIKAINWSGGGEPTLHPDFERFLFHAARQGVKQGLFTNGYNTIPAQELFAWIRISLTDKGFARIKKPHVPFGICVNHVESYSNDDLLGFCLEAHNFGARYFQIRPALVGSYDKQPILKAPTFLQRCAGHNFDVYVTDYKYKEAIKPKDYSECYGYHFCPSIDWNGKLSVCLYLTLNPEYILGDLNKESLLDIWHAIEKSAVVTEKCQNCCKNHEINKLLYKTKNIHLEDFL